MYKLLLLLGLSCFLMAPFTGRAQSSWVDSTLNTMSLDEKIGQLIMVAAYSNKDSLYEKQLGTSIEKYHIGGIIFFQGGPKSQALMTNKYQQKSRIPLSNLARSNPGHESHIPPRRSHRSTMQGLGYPREFRTRGRYQRES